MKPPRRFQRTLILAFLSISVLAPIVLVSNRLKTLSSIGGNGFIEDLNSIKYRTDALKLKAVRQEVDEGLKEPTLVVYKNGDLNRVLSYSSSDQNDDSEKSSSARRNIHLMERNGTHQGKIEVQENKQNATGAGRKETLNQTIVQHDQGVSSSSKRVTDVRVSQMKDQLLRAKMYLRFTPPNSNSHLLKELRQRIKELDRAVGEATKDSELARSALQKMKSMEVTLLKASRIYTDCPAMASKLRAMAYNTEEQARAHKNQATYLVELAARTTPKGLHCLSMQLTAEYFELQSEEKELPGQDKLLQQDLLHFVVFSDNVLACAVVVNSTVFTATEPEKVVLHIVTDSLNHPAISMWFLLNPPGGATIEILNMDNFKWLDTDYDSRLKNQGLRDPRYTSPLNHLRFYLPDIFPGLNKILLLDHDVVVQRDLSALWDVDMNGMVVAAVETCQEGESSFHRMDMFINFSDPMIAKEFDVKACTWAFGMNVFDLQEWRRQSLTSVYNKYLQLGFERPLWSAGTLPLAWVTFYNRTVPLDRRWHALGLGHDPSIEHANIKRSAVIHYDGAMKPWMDIGIGRYKGYWSKFVKYDDPHLQRCNIHL